VFYQIDLTANKDPLFFDHQSGQEISSIRLAADIERFLDKLGEPEKSLCFIFCDQSYSTALAYLSLLNSKHAAFLGDSAHSIELKKRLVDAYEPRWIWSSNALEGMGDYLLMDHFVDYLYVRKKNVIYPIHQDLKLLLSSSGTTGSPKMIRLSAKNLQANASSIADYLKLKKSDKAITSLPLHYSFGLSVLNSFLEVKAKVILTNDSLVSRGFWEVFKKQEVNFLAGVPFSFDILSQLRFGRMELPSLSYLVQAGGRLSQDKIQVFAKEAKDKNADFYVMYGQTEATARISYVPPERLEEKSSSIGIAIPGGTLHLKLDSEDSQEGELVYEGPNVMLGYADSFVDLALGDEMHGLLHTGDLAKKDKEGYFYLTGRLKRFLKLFGLRFNLDEAEVFLNRELCSPTICFGDDDCLQIRVESDDESIPKKAIELINNTYHLHHSKVRVELIQKIPRNSSGKIQYSELA
jgi:long-chain acyl-CoA synthetase